MTERVMSLEERRAGDVVAALLREYFAEAARVCGEPRPYLTDGTIDVIVRSDGGVVRTVLNMVGYDELLEERDQLRRIVNDVDYPFEM